jgi:ABC-type multidrug transport system ATPase subunit
VTAALSADSMRKRYGRRWALTAAWLTASAGEITAIVGRNGSGKTTLFRCITGAVRADSGLVMFRGRRYPRPLPHVLAREGLWYVPADGLTVPAFSPLDHERMLRRRFGAALAPAAWDVLGLDGVLDQPCGRLSTGERRLVDVALSTMRRPLCLLADEPLRDLDPKRRERVADALRQLARQGCAVVVTGHQLNDLAGLADAVLVMRDGQTRWVGEGKMLGEEVLRPGPPLA